MHSWWAQWSPPTNTYPCDCSFLVETQGRVEATNANHRADKPCLGLPRLHIHLAIPLTMHWTQPKPHVSISPMTQSHKCHTTNAEAADVIPASEHSHSYSGCHTCPSEHLPLGSLSPRPPIPPAMDDCNCLPACSLLQFNLHFLISTQASACPGWLAGTCICLFISKT